MSLPPHFDVRAEAAFAEIVAFSHVHDRDHRPYERCTSKLCVAVQTLRFEIIAMSKWP